MYSEFTSQKVSEWQRQESGIIVVARNVFIETLWHDWRYGDHLSDITAKEWEIGTFLPQDFSEFNHSYYPFGNDFLD